MIQYRKILLSFIIAQSILHAQIGSEEIVILSPAPTEYFILPDHFSILVPVSIKIQKLEPSRQYKVRYKVDDDNDVALTDAVFNTDSYTFATFNYVIVTPGAHTLYVYLDRRRAGQDPTYDNNIKQNNAPFLCDQQFYLFIKNSFNSGTIYVDDPLHLSPKSNNNKVTKYKYADVRLGAIDQPNGSYQMVWNVSGSNTSNWMKKIGVNNPVNIDQATPRDYTYTVQDINTDANAILIADMKVAYSINQYHTTEVDGTTLNGTTYIVDQNSGTDLAPKR